MDQKSLKVEDYQTLTDIEHVLKRPDMYIGLRERIQRETKAFDLATRKIMMKKVMQAEGLEQLFIEIIGNVADNVTRSRENGVDPIQAEIWVQESFFSVKNYGMFIPVAQNENGIWIPYMNFGMLRSGSNYDDTKVRMYIGKNGIGAKATNIYALTFAIECADPERGLLYKQVWSNHMTEVSEPEITPYKGIGYTQVICYPDFSYFGTTGFDQEALEMYAAHAIAVSYTCHIPVYFNGEVFNVANIAAYAKYFFDIDKKNSICYSDPNGVYELCLVDTPNQAICLSFVNSISTPKGGVHVDAAYAVIVAAISEFLGKNLSGIKITKRDVVDDVSLFLTCRINQPKFDNQSKQQLKSPAPKIELPTPLVNGIKNWQLIQMIYARIQQKQEKQLKKTDGKRGKKRLQIKEIEDANYAVEGWPNSEKATLLICEGKSANSYLVTFLSQVPNGRGRDYYGTLSLRGKPKNALKADFLTMLENTEFKNIKQALRLEEGLDYNNPKNRKRLRYGKVCLVPDADEDGKHILGLVLIFFFTRFPSLLTCGYVFFMRTPVVRVRLDQIYCFYTEFSYHRWLKACLDQGYHIPEDNIDYYKGLGTSDDDDVKQDFGSPKIVQMFFDEMAAAKLLLAFQKKDSDQRKEWILSYLEENCIEVDNINPLPISTFIDNEYIHYPRANLIRSIPFYGDGLKESQRKILWVARHLLFSKKSKKIKVMNITSRVIEELDYKHGNTSLDNAIVSLTQDFVGANNMPFFIKKGQFGTRNEGGKDCPAARYPYLSGQPWLKLVFRKEDRGLERRLKEDGVIKECESFFPILPMHVINGVKGVALGWSSEIPAHNPMDIIFWLQNRLMRTLDPSRAKSSPTLKPWYRGFKGQILLTKKGYQSKGIIEVIPNGGVVVSELPIGEWTLDYRLFLDRLQDEGVISGYDNHSTDNSVKFVIHKLLDTSIPLHKRFKMTKNGSYNNMTVLHLIDEKNPGLGVKAQIFRNLNELLEDFYNFRLGKYHERKELQVLEIEQQIKDLTDRARFILLKIKGELIIENRVESELEEEMDSLKLPVNLLDKVVPREYTLGKVAQLEKRIENKKKEMDSLLNLKPEQMWFDELEEVAKWCCRHEKFQRSTYESCNNVNVIIPKGFKNVTVTLQEDPAIN